MIASIGWSAWPTSAPFASKTRRGASTAVNARGQRMAARTPSISSQRQPSCARRIPDRGTSAGVPTHGPLVHQVGSCHGTARDAVDATVPQPQTTRATTMAKSAQPRSRLTRGDLPSTAGTAGLLRRSSTFARAPPLVGQHNQKVLPNLDLLNRTEAGKCAWTVVRAGDALGFAFG